MLSGSDYIKQAYKNIPGYITRMYINNREQGTYTYHYTTDNLAALPSVDEENLYISQNTFYRPLRNKDSLKRLNMLYIDLDCYKLGLQKEYVLDILSDEYIGSKIPRPTYIVDSGRGLYLLWKIDEDKNAFPRWKMVQHFLHSTLKDLGSDASVVEDSARVLRIPGSINSKTGTKVEILNECNYTYTLHEIIREYLPDHAVKKNSYSRDYKKKNGKIIRFTSMNTLLYARIKDIETVLLERDRLGNVYLRENCLFLYRYFCCCYYNDISKALQMTLDLWNRLSNKQGYKEREIIRRTKSGEKYYLQRNRKFSNRKIIELLGITEDEQDKLITLISKQCAADRKMIRNRKAYEKKIEEKGLKLKSEGVKARREEIKKYLNMNKSQEVICNLLSISKATYYRDLAAIKDNEYGFVNDALIDVKGSEVNEDIKDRDMGRLEPYKIEKELHEIYVSQNLSLCINRDVVPSLCPERRGKIILFTDPPFS